jgi:RNA polymerase II C-terminal domain phosphatase-like 3/4
MSVSSPFLVLVIDLDHTLVHSVHSIEAFDYRNNVYYPNLHYFKEIDVWTKIRPHALEFLRRVKFDFQELHVYTMGTRTYAEAVCKLLDPSATLFTSIVCKEDFDSNPAEVGPNFKCLRGLLKDNTTVILDDSPEMWPRHKLNTLSISRYFFQPFAGIQTDVEDSALLKSLNVLKRVKVEMLWDWDVRSCLSKVLSR